MEFRHNTQAKIVKIPLRKQLDMVKVGKQVGPRGRWTANALIIYNY